MQSTMTLVSLQVNRLVNLLMKLALWLGMALCAVMLIAALGQVLSRTTSLFDFEESEEIALFSMAWLAMLGSAVALRQGRHLGVRLLVEKLPSGVYDKFICPGVQLLMLAFFLVVAIYGGHLAIEGLDQYSPSLDIPMTIPYLSLPIGGGLMALNVISDMLQDRFPTAEGSTANIATSVMEDLGELQAEADANTEVFDPIHNPQDEENQP